MPRLGTGELTMPTTDKTETTNTTNTQKSAAAASAFPFPTFASFDPMAMWATTQQTFAKLMADSTTRSQALADQFVAMETQFVARAHDAINTWSQLAHDALTYGTQLTAETRKLGVDAAKKMAPQA
jgi:hypothetical protein